jgi:hypothetical protein
MMRNLIIGIILFGHSTCLLSQDISKAVFSSGASNAANANIQLRATAGQTIIGSGQSSSVKGNFGFWAIALKLLSTSISEIPDFGHENKFILSQNYPNPASDYTFLKFHLPQSIPLRIVLYNLQGEQIEVVYEEKLNAGSYLVKVDLRRIPVGSYIYSLQSNRTILASKPLVITK